MEMVVTEEAVKAEEGMGVMGKEGWVREGGEGGGEKRVRRVDKAVEWTG